MNITKKISRARLSLWPHRRFLSDRKNQPEQASRGNLANVFLWYRAAPSVCHADPKLPAYGATKKGTLTRAVIRRGHWEPLETAAYIDCPRQGSFVIDVGANFGHYSLVAAEFIGVEGKVLAFEPHGPTFGLLQENCSLQPAPIIEPIWAGIAAENGTLALTEDTGNPGGHSFVAANVYGQGAAETVSVYSLDSYLSAHHAELAVNVIKIDVQGLEAQVIKGAAQTIERHRPTIFLEISPRPMRQAGDDYRSLPEYFEEQGYQASIVDHYNGTVITVDYEQAASRLADPAIEYLDFLFKDNQAK